MDEQLIINDAYGASIANGTRYCHCDQKIKRDIGSLDNHESKNIHIFICDNHKTIMKHKEIV